MKQLNFHVERFLERLRVGRDPLATVLDACKNLCEAGLDRDRGDPIKEMAHFKKWIENTTTVEELTKVKFDVGTATRQDVKQAEASRLEAEIALLKYQLQKK